MRSGNCLIGKENGMKKQKGMNAFGKAMVETLRESVRNEMLFIAKAKKDKEMVLRDGFLGIYCTWDADVIIAELVKELNEHKDFVARVESDVL